MEWLLRHRQTKRAETDTRIPNSGWKPIFYSNFLVFVRMVPLLKKYQVLHYAIAR